MRARFIVMVPVQWSGTVNEFKVEVEAEDLISKDNMANVRKAAIQDVESRGMTVVTHTEPKVYRKK